MALTVVEPQGAQANGVEGDRESVEPTELQNIKRNHRKYIYGFL